MSVCLMCLIGLPASGKSTLVGQLVKHFGDKVGIKVVPIHYDDKIEWTQSNSTWRDQRKSVLSQVDNLLRNKSEEATRLVILDDNMYYRSMRYEYYQLAKQHECSYCQVFLEASIETVAVRNSLRPDPVPDQVIQRMWNKLEKPDPVKFFWERNSLVLSSDTYALVDIEGFVKKSLEDPLTPRVAETKPEEEKVMSELHLVDIALRKAVGDQIKNGIELGLYMQVLTSKLSTRRLSILKDIKGGSIVLPPYDEGITKESIIIHYKNILFPLLKDC